MKITPSLVAGLSGSGWITADHRAGQTQLSREGIIRSRLANRQVILLRSCISTTFTSVVYNIQKAIGCRPPGCTRQLNSSCAFVQQSTDPAHTRDADILNAFLAQAPTSRSTTPVKCVPGKLATAEVPAKHVSGYMGRCLRLDTFTYTENASSHLPTNKP